VPNKVALPVFIENAVKMTQMSNGSFSLDSHCEIRIMIAALEENVRAYVAACVSQAFMSRTKKSKKNSSSTSNGSGRSSSCSTAGDADDEVDEDMEDNGAAYDESLPCLSQEVC
jgi:hypothetical protein